MRPYFRKNPHHTHDSIKAAVTAKSATPYFTSRQLASIYKFPSPSFSSKRTVAVISFGGGLVGTVASATSASLLNLTDNRSDLQAHWAYLGLSPATLPTVIVAPMNGATNSPNPSDGATIENTIDVETIAAMCPTSNLTIILYIVPNTLAGFSNLLTAASQPLTVAGVTYAAPSVISCSWGAPEAYFSSSLANSINTQLQTLANKGVMMTVATGDNGSSDGLSGTNVDFPSCSPYVLACGGTNLVCPNYIYDGSTTETAWSSGGGGVSVLFPKPTYQSSLTGTGRSTPDLALVADPSTGVIYTIGKQQSVVGGTSIVSPAMAAFLASIQNNQSVTPLLYTADPSNFHDITVGSNGAYGAKANYDNCTGWGSIVGNILATTLQPIPPVLVTGITLSTSTLALTVPTRATLVATVAPPTATNKTITWSSSNQAVATVANGVVTPLTAGTTTITATTADGGFQATCAVTCTTVPIPISRITLTPTLLAMTVGTTSATTVGFVPSNSATAVTNWVVTRSSPVVQGTTVATVNGSGVVTAVGNGSATITATVGGVSASRTVTVTTPVTGINVSQTSVSVPVRGSVTVTATTVPTTASNQSITWTSSNNLIATVSNSGTIRGVRVGTTTVTASVGGFSKTVRVTVTP